KSCAPQTCGTETRSRSLPRWRIESTGLRPPLQNPSPPGGRELLQSPPFEGKGQVVISPGAALPTFSGQERDRRWRETRARMAQAGIDVLALLPAGGHWDHWLSN